MIEMIRVIKKSIMNLGYFIFGLAEERLHFYESFTDNS